VKYESGLQNVYVIISDKRSDYEDIKSTINAGMLKSIKLYLTVWMDISMIKI